MTKSYRLELDDDIAERLEAQAEREERKPTTMARLLLKRALDVERASLTAKQETPNA